MTRSYLGAHRQARLVGRFFAGRPTFLATFLLVAFFAAFTFRARAARAFTRFWASFARASGDIGRRFFRDFLDHSLRRRLGCEGCRSSYGRAYVRDLDTFTKEVGCNNGRLIRVTGSDDLNRIAAECDSVSRQGVPLRGVAMNEGHHNDAHKRDCETEHLRVTESGIRPRARQAPRPTARTLTSHAPPDLRHCGRVPDSLVATETALVLISQSAWQWSESRHRAFSR